jgi:hypothetical protein
MGSRVRVPPGSPAKSIAYVGIFDNDLPRNAIREGHGKEGEAKSVVIDDGPSSQLGTVLRCRGLGDRGERLFGDHLLILLGLPLDVAALHSSAEFHRRQASAAASAPSGSERERLGRAWLRR